MSTMQTSNVAIAPTQQPQVDLAKDNLPAVNRGNVFSNLVSAAALSAALTNGAPALAQTNTPLPEPTPKVAPPVPGQAANTVQGPVYSPLPVIDAAVAQQFIVTQVPGGNPPAAPAPAAVVNDRVDITRLPQRPFCMDDAGNVIRMGDRRSQVNRPGSFVEGYASTGVALQALTYAKDHLLKANGGKIPDGYKAVLVIGGGEEPFKYPLNLDTIPPIAGLSQASHARATRDQLNGEAIGEMHKRRITVENDQGLFTIEFQSPMSVVLEKK